MEPPATPGYQSRTAAPSSVRLPMIRTPARLTPARFTPIRTPGSTTRQHPGTATPHTIRALQRLNAARTPVRQRRQSGRLQRETPRDILRNLSRALAPASKPLKSSSPSEQQPSDTQDDDDLDQPPPPRPRLSLPLEFQPDSSESDDDESLSPPQLTMVLDDENVTSRSIEDARRERVVDRLSLGKFEDTRMSDAFNEFTQVGGTGGLVDGTDAPVFVPITDFQPVVDDEPIDTGGDTEDLRRFDIRFSLPNSEFADFTQQEDENFQSEESGFQLDFDARQAADFIAPQPAPLPEGDSKVTDSPSLDLSPDFSPGGSSDDSSHLSPHSASAGQHAGASSIARPLPIPPSPVRVSPVSNAGDRFTRKRSPQQSDRRTRSASAISVRELGPIRRKKEPNFSRHGVLVPSLPAGVVKKLANQCARTGSSSKSKLNRECLVAIEEASDWFFEQISTDLETYSQHAGRKTIDEADAITLMKRQRHLGNTATVFSLAQKHLPKELLQDIRMSFPP